jgi:hypothetical protein
MQMINNDPATFPRPLPPAKPNMRLIAALNKQFGSNVIEADWRLFATQYVTTNYGQTLPLHMWAHDFITHGVIPFLREKGLALQMPRPTYIEENLLSWLHASRHSMPPPKHRGLDKYRWVFETTVSLYDWMKLLDHWGVPGILDNDSNISIMLPEFAYIHICPEQSHAIIEDVAAEKKVNEEESALRAEHEHGSWSWLRGHHGTDE